MADLRYPIGPFVPAPVTADLLRRSLVEMAAQPGELRRAVEGLSAAQLDTPYRPDGWTARQVVHHIADAHMNWYIRTRLALTEPEPTIKPYAEALWAELSDARTGPLEPSLAIVDGVCTRWVALFESLTDADWRKTIQHPERGVMRVDELPALNAWHGKHHTAQVTALRQRMGWR